MNIMYNVNKFDAIKNIILQKSRYQKVMLLYDDNVSQYNISQLLNIIKEDVIFNKMHISSIDECELNNGYKTIIYFCCADSYLKLNIDKREFINIFCPIGPCLLPFFSSKDSCLCKCKDDYMIVAERNFDVNMLSSLCFNMFYNYCKNLLTQQSKAFDFSMVSREINQNNLFDIICQLDEDFELVDIQILKTCNISCEQSALLHLIILNGFLTLINSMKTESLMLVDVFKSAQENENEIDKFYTMYYTDSFTNLVLLNFNNLLKHCVGIKQKVRDCLKAFDFSMIDAEKIIQEVKGFARKDNGIIGYLYLFNVFGV